MVGSEQIFFSNDQNFISDPVIAKYLRSNLRFPEHYMNELPYRAILFGFLFAHSFKFLCYIISKDAKTMLRSISLKNINQVKN